MSTADANQIVSEYESIWYFSDFWPGEYPPRFSVTQDGVVLMGRPEMKLTSPQNVSCPVPKFATFSPWNHERNNADNLLYKTVSKPSLVSITGPVSVLASNEIDRTNVTLDLQHGDTLLFLVYHGEGFALYRYQNQNYVIDESDFRENVSFEENPREDDLWLELPAENGGRGWVLFSDAEATSGTALTDIEGFGIANDLPDPASLRLEGISFAGGSAELTDASQHILNELAEKLRQVRDVQYEVSGHTDSIGSSQSNLTLSQQRADAVVDYLKMQLTNNSVLLVARGYGEEHPIADNTTPEGREINRRVELQKMAS